MKQQAMKSQRMTESQIFMIIELAAQLNIKTGCISLLDFEGAYYLIEHLKAQLREIKRTRGHVWTEDEVRSRLKDYNNDDSMYYAKIAKPKLIQISRVNKSEPEDPRIIKRVDLDRGIDGALWNFNKRPKPETQKQKDLMRLYVVIYWVYILDMGVATTAAMLYLSKRSVYYLAEEAVSKIAGFLNGNLTNTDNGLPD